MKTIIAIDPGISGGIAIMRGSEIFTQGLEKGDDETTCLISEYKGPDTVAYIEKVGGYIPKGEDGEGQPGSRMFTFGDSYGFLRGLLKAYGIETKFIVPQMWQRGIAGRKGTYAQRKKALREHAKKLFPDLDVTSANADALGLLHYARFKETGANLGYEAQEATMAEQMEQAVAWCKAQGWAVPPARTSARADMFNYWLNQVQVA